MIFTNFMPIFAVMNKICLFLATMAAGIGAWAAPYTEPADDSVRNPLPWADLPQGAVVMTWTDIDSLKPRHEVPSGPVIAADTLRGWRGETLMARALLYSPAAIGDSLSLHMPGADPRWVRYVLTDDQRSCGRHNFALEPWSAGDIIDLPGALPLAAREVRPIWVTIPIAADAAPGLHSYRLSVERPDGSTLASLPLTVEVIDRELPPPAQWKFHTDFWQQPYAVSRYYGLERWSPAHFEALEPYLRQLARAGQKPISTILFYEPWGDQSHDKFDPMVQAARSADGSWEFTYDIFDRYVELADSCGLGPQISCYSMIPWDMSFRYIDLPTGEYRYLQTSTDTPEYRELWSAFLTDFAAHLRRKGWFDRTCIAMDERPLDAMLNAYNLVQQTVPGMKMALAGNYHPELTDKLHDYSITVRHTFPAEVLEARRAAGMNSTLYTCCTESAPNLLSNNEPADAAALPLHCLACGTDGYLHWSWINWPDRPLEDSRFRLFSAGDTYLFYPGPRSSVRFERYIDGVQQVEKIRLLDQAGADLTEVREALKTENPRLVKTAINKIK